MLRCCQCRIQLMQPLTEYTGPIGVETQDILAAANAVNGDYQAAIGHARRAIQFAGQAGDEQRTLEIQARLEKYQRNEPHIDRVERN